MWACLLSWRNQKWHRYIVYNSNYLTIETTSPRHLFHNQRTSLSTCCPVQVQHLSMRSFAVSWHNTWAQDPRTSKMHFCGGLKCVPSTLAYLGWCRTTYLFLVCPICMPVCHRPHPVLATSTDVECVFSKGRLVLSHICNWLSVTSTHALMCLGAWSKLGLVHDADIKVAAILPDIIGEEDELRFGWDYMTYDYVVLPKV